MSRLLLLLGWPLRLLLLACFQPASAFMPSSLPILRHMRLAPVAAATPGQRTGLWGLGRLLNRFRGTLPRPPTGQVGGAESSSITWTIDLEADMKIEDEASRSIHISPLFSVGRFDFRLVAATASSQNDEQPRLSLYLEHFPSSELAAVPSVKCRLRWSGVPEEGDMNFEHTFDNPLASSMLAGKEDLVSFPPAGAEVRVEATVILCGVHFPSRQEREEMEELAWQQLLRKMDMLGGVGDRVGEHESKEASQRVRAQVEVEGMRLLAKTPVEVNVTREIRKP